MTMMVLAQGGTGSPPAGGGEMSQVIGGTIGAMIVTAAMFYLVLGHRSGRVKLLNTLGLYSERKSGLPPWCALPLAVLSGALLIAVFGMYWDISTHLDAGRDPGPFANASHYFILVGLFGVFFAGLLAIFLPTEKPGPTALRLPGGLEAPLGGVLILVCSGIALTGFPLDDVWHRIFGQDVTLWGPTHLLLFGGASMSTLGGMILLMEGATASREVRPERVTRNVRIQQVLLGGAFLIGLSTFQGEFDFAVPQFRLVFHPVLLMLASSVALVAVRIWAGPGAALGAAVFFILVRGILTVLVSPLFGHTTLHFPLYLAEAAVVELIALRVGRDKPLQLGLLAGLGIGTVGLAAEWAWSYAWWTISWPSSMLVEGVVCGFVAAVAGGVTGGFIGRALSSPELAPKPVPRFALPAALVALVAVVAYATPVTAGDPIKADVTLTDVTPAPEARRSTSRSSSTRPTPPTTTTGSRPPPGRARTTTRPSPRWRRSRPAPGAAPSRCPCTGTGSRRCACTRASRSRASRSTSPRTRRSRSRPSRPSRASRASSSATRSCSSASRSPASHRCCRSSPT